MEQESIARQIATQIARLGTAENAFKASLQAVEVRLALRAMGSAAAPVLRQYWAAADEQLRDIILDVLGEIGDARDVAWLLEPAAQPEHVWHHAALGSLARLAGDLALPLLTATLADPNATTSQRRYAVSLLRFITSPPAAREAARACARDWLDHAEDTVRRDAAWAYYLLPEAPDQVGNDAAQALLHPEHDISLLQIACKALLQQRGEAALLEIWPRLTSTVRANVLSVAARRSGWAYDDYGAVAEIVIQQGLADPQALVRFRAVAVAAACRPPVVTERLFEMLSQERDEDTWNGLCDALLLLSARPRLAAIYPAWPKSQRQRLRAYLRARRRDAPDDAALQAELVALTADLQGGRQRPHRQQHGPDASSTQETITPLPSPPEQLTIHLPLAITLPAPLPLKRPRRPAVTLAAGPLAVHWDLDTVVASMELAMPLHNVHSIMRFHDHTGQSWRATASLRPAALCAALLAATRKPLAVRRAERLPPAWRQGLTAGLLLGGLRDLWDTREYIVLRLEDAELEVAIKYQGPRVSIGSLGEQPASEAVVLVEQLSHQGDPLPAVAFSVPWVELVFGYRWDAKRQRWQPIQDFSLTLEAIADSDAVAMQ
jgi:hypothetical protein